jgi:FxLD family lantipeptide
MAMTVQSTTTLDVLDPDLDNPTGADAFDDLDIRVIEAGGPAVDPILLTDDGCDSSCPESCATNVA